METDIRKVKDTSSDSKIHLNDTFSSDDANIVVFGMSLTMKESDRANNLVGK